MNAMLINGQKAIISYDKSLDMFRGTGMGVRSAIVTFFFCSWLHETLQ